MIATFLQQVDPAPAVGVDQLVTPQVPWSYLAPLLILSVGVAGLGAVAFGSCKQFLVRRRRPHGV